MNIQSLSARESGKHELISTKNIVWVLCKFLFRQNKHIYVFGFKTTSLSIYYKASSGEPSFSWYQVAGTHGYCSVREANNG